MTDVGELAVVAREEVQQDLRATLPGAIRTSGTTAFGSSKSGASQAQPISHDRIQRTASPLRTRGSAR